MFVLSRRVKGLYRLGCSTHRAKHSLLKIENAGNESSQGRGQKYRKNLRVKNSDWWFDKF